MDSSFDNICKIPIYRTVNIKSGNFNIDIFGEEDSVKNTVIRKHLANSAIGVVFVAAIALFIASFLPLQRFHDLVFNYIEINRFVQRLISIVLLFIAWHLYQRKRYAWTICIILLSVSLFLHFVLHHHTVGIIIIICQIYALAALLMCYGDFRRPSDRLSLKHALIFAGLTIVAVIVSAAAGRNMLIHNTGETVSVGESFLITFRVIFGESSQYSIYDWFVFCLIWLCAIACVVMVLHSAIINRKASEKEKAFAREIVIKYGQNSSSYLALEDDKKLFFGKEVDGVIAYGVVGNVVTVCGDPICAHEDFIQFLAEFKAFCVECSYQCIFLGTTELFLPQYEMLGYSHVKAGEEARFHLEEYQLSGGKMAKLRAQINHANKETVTHEYRPTLMKDEKIEKGIDAVSDAWLEGKKSGQLGFSVGGVGLDDPMDRRYFYATDEAGKIVAFNVFLPYDNMKGYLADVTRRVPHAPGGVTEKLIFDGFMSLKEEGAEWGSMGMATLANVHEEGVKEGITVKLLDFIYEKCNRFYGFKDLHKAKEKYSPTVWAPGYFVYSTKNITPEIAFAAIKIQNPAGMKDFVLSSVKSRFHY